MVISRQTEIVQQCIHLTTFEEGLLAIHSKGYALRKKLHFKVVQLGIKSRQDDDLQGMSAVDLH